LSRQYSMRRCPSTRMSCPCQTIRACRQPSASRLACRLAFSAADAAGMRALNSGLILMLSLSVPGWHRRGTGAARLSFMSRSRHKPDRSHPDWVVAATNYTAAFHGQRGDYLPPLGLSLAHGPRLPLDGVFGEEARGFNTRCLPVVPVLA